MGISKSGAYAHHTAVLGLALSVDETSERETAGTVCCSILHDVAPGHWHVVQDPAIISSFTYYEII